MTLAAFKKKHQKTVDELNGLESEVSASYKECEQAFIQNKTRLGNSYRGFTVGFRRSIDAELLVTLMPNAIGFVEMSLLIPDFEKMVEDGAIPDDVAEQVVVNSEVIKGPSEPRKKKK